MLDSLIWLGLACLVWFLVYQVFFSPLAPYPGPLLAKISPLYNVYHAWKKDIHQDLQRLHERHGDVVRYGPGRLCFRSSRANLDIYGQANGSHALCKSDGYCPHPYYPEEDNTFTTTDRFQAKRLRGMILPALKIGPITSHDEDIRQCTRTFVRTLLGDQELGHDGWAAPVDISSRSLFYTMDMIMQMIYGRHLDMMGSRRHRWLAQALLDGNHYMYLCLASPTIFRSQVAHWLGFRDRFFPGMAHESQWFDAIAAELFDSRDTNHPASGGIVAAMRQAVDEKTGLSFEGEVVRKEAVMLARAGGDTTAVALAACFFYLSTDAVVYKRVTGEIRSTFDSMDDIFQTDNLSRCEYLIASIDEAMRLTPPVPGCLWRKVERDVMVDGRLVPRGTEVGVCQYALHRCHNLFPNPDHFEPQRFLKTTDHDVPPGAYTPFQHGPRACPARLLALRELRFALAQVLWQMDVRVFPLHAVNAVTGDSGVELKIEDIFSSKAKAQFLQFRPRSGLAV